MYKNDKSQNNQQNIENENFLNLLDKNSNSELFNKNVIEQQVLQNSNYLFNLNENEIEELCNRILNYKKETDPFWIDMGKIMLKSVIYYVKSQSNNEEQTLEKCLEIIQKSLEKDENNLYEKLIENLSFSHPSKILYQSIKICPYKTYKAILQNLEEDLLKYLK